MRQLIRFLAVVGVLTSLLGIPGQAGAKGLPGAQGQPDGNVSRLQNSRQAGQNSPAAAQWYNGSIVYSTITNCVSTIQGVPYNEYGIGTYIGYLADPFAAQPGPNEVYYIHVVVAGMGNACTGQRFFLDISLPANTTLATGTNPIYCFADNVSTADCPQTLSPSSWNVGAYAYLSTDAAHAYLWPMPQGHTWEFQIPVRTSTTLTNSALTAHVWALDGNSSPWLQPSVGVYVYNNLPVVIYPSPSTEKTASGYKSSSYVYSHGAGGNAYFDLGTAVGSYSLYTDGPAVIPSNNNAFIVWSDWTPYSLAPNTTYHWRVRFVSNGQTYYGVDQVFQTTPTGQVTVGSGTSASCTSAALDTALASAGLTSILFNCGTASVTINLSGAKILYTSLTIDGGNKVTLQGNNTFRLFDVLGGTLSLNKIVLSGGNSAGCGGAVHVGSGASLSTDTARFTGNTASANGGAICLDGGANLALNTTQVTGNSTAGSGGGIYNAGSADVRWSDISANTSGDNGGGVYNSGIIYFGTSVLASNSTPNPSALFDRTKNAGGGLYNSGTVDFYTSTVAGNTASYGGGVFNNGGTITMTNMTVTGNTANSGARALIANAQAGGLDSSVSGSASLRNTLLAGNIAGAVLGNCGTSSQKTIVSLGDNLDSENQCGFTQPGDLVNTNPLIGTLGYNGGKTRTVPLFPASPAIDSANNVYCGMFDERGFYGPTPVGDVLQRAVDGNRNGAAVCDIGAFEYRPTVYLPNVLK